MTINGVQSKRASVASTLSVDVTLDSAPAVGNALIASYRETDGAAVVTLPAGFQWTPLSPFGPAGRLSGIAYKEATDSAQLFTFTSGTLDTKTVILKEVSGLDLNSLGPENDTPNALAITALALEAIGPLPQPDMYVMTNVNLSGGSGGSNAIDQGFSLLECNAATNDAFLTAELITGSVDALGPTWSWLTSRAAQGQLASFKGASDPEPQPWPRGHVALHRRRRRRLSR